MLGLALLLGVMAVRVVAAGTGRTGVITWPRGSSRWSARLVDEQDVSLLGARVLKWAWRLKRREREQLVPARHNAYVELRAEEGLTTSPVVDTLLGRQTTCAFDIIVFEPENQARAASFKRGRVGNRWIKSYRTSPWCSRVPLPRRRDAVH